MHVSRALLTLLTTLSVASAPLWAHTGEGSQGPSKALMKRLFPAADSFVTKPVAVTPAQRKAIESRLGKTLEGHDLKTNAYIASSGGRSAGIIWVTDAHLQEGLVDVVVGVDTQGKLTGVALEHSPNPRLAQSGYLGQYKGLTVRSAFQEGKDLKPLTGQAPASKLVAQAVKKAATTIHVVFLGGAK